MPDIKSLLKYRISLLTLCAALGSMYGQKEPQYTQYMYNIGSFNPAYVGTVESPEIIGLYRSQWMDIDGAPTTIRAGANIDSVARAYPSIIAPVLPKNRRAGLKLNGNTPRHAPAMAIAYKDTCFCPSLYI